MPSNRTKSDKQAQLGGTTTSKPLTKKIDVLLGFCRVGNYRSAMKLASSWANLGEHKGRIQKAWAAASNPDFYKQINQDPDIIFADGVQALRERYLKEGDYWPPYKS